ncbi:MAG TPA: hypothetical protein VJZ32_01265, partial [Candidatus Bathyarchaeia archaeon]|nr:hypothetical protein [Candidatus Bathyarchaeia archaeon]
WSKELLEANEPKSHYCPNEYGSHAGFVLERSRDSILSHRRLAVFATESVENGWRSCISETKSA